MNAGKQRRLVVLGSTGSVGRNTLEVAGLHPELYQVAGLSVRSNTDVLIQQLERYRPAVVAVEDEQAGKGLQNLLDKEGLQTRLICGQDAATRLVEELQPDLVMAAIVGSAGLRSALCAVELGKTVMVANKEPLVMAGHLFKQAAADSGARILPVDSEHNAIFQCVMGVEQFDKEVRDIILTASGGPFFRGDKPQSWNALADVTPDQAIAHPNWNMGAKISVDSATMMNKGLEIIEASHLFDLDVSHISVMLHPQSVVHSVVNFVDGSSLAQMGLPDMRVPIANAMAWPGRHESGVEPVSLAEVGSLDFRIPDYEQMPCLRLARDVAQDGSPVLATSLNAANEIAVAAFLDGRLAFTGIPEVIAKVLDDCNGNQANDVETLIEVDKTARTAANKTLESL